MWWKVHFDPEKLLIGTADTTFARTLGVWAQSGGDRIPFGMAYNCDACKEGRANIDLRGTCFGVKSEFFADGCMAGGAAKKSHHDQVVEMSGGGYCGWICSEMCQHNEDIAKQGGWHLQLYQVK